MLTPQEVASHNTLEDLWLIVAGKAFNLSQFAPEHPGGYKILLKCESAPKRSQDLCTDAARLADGGKDAT